MLTEPSHGFEQFIIPPETAKEEIESRISTVKEITKAICQKIIETPSEEATFENTFGTLDELCGYMLRTLELPLCFLQYIGTEESLCALAQEKLAEWSDWQLQNVGSNHQLYRVLQRTAVKAQSEEESLLAKTVLLGLKLDGAELEGAQKEKFCSLQKRTLEAKLQFEANIARAGTGGIWVAEPELKGLSQDFIKNLQKNSEGLYFLNVIASTYMRVQQECKVESTRQRLYEAYIQRAYPENLPLLEQIRELRQESAQMLGFKTAAEAQLARTMAETSSTIEKFLTDIDEQSRRGAEQEVAQVKQYAQKLGLLNEKGEIEPYNINFIIHDYEKNLLHVDSKEVENYFPVRTTLERMLKLYSDFLNLDMEASYTKEPWWWSDDLMMICVKDKNKKVLGRIVLDLFPRPGKFTHACHLTLLHGRETERGSTPTLSVVLANFPRSSETSPGLLRHGEVTTFFHEFGHAMHAVCGRTRFLSQSGTQVKMDFVEVPSQMFEQWMWQPEILKMVSSHVHTGQPLPDELITALCKSNSFLRALFFQRQLFLARYSLGIYTEPTDAVTLKKRCWENQVRIFEAHEKDHFECSFCHLGDYGARYYSYLWSLVYALDLFDYVETNGLSNKAVGERFGRTVLGKGDSQEPLTILQNFLGREPSLQPFSRYIAESSF